MLSAPLTAPRATSGTLIRASDSSFGVPGTTIVRGSRLGAFDSTGSRCSTAQPVIPSPKRVEDLRMCSAQGSRASTGLSTRRCSSASYTISESNGTSSPSVAAIRSSSASRFCSESTSWNTSASRR